MKKNAVLSVVALLMCFLVGYAAFQTAYLVRNWIAESFNDCKSNRNADCAEKEEMPNAGFDRR